MSDLLADDEELAEEDEDRFCMQNAAPETPFGQRASFNKNGACSPLTVAIASPAPEQPAAILTHQPYFSVLSHQGSGLSHQGSGMLAHQSSFHSAASGPLQHQHSLLSQNSGLQNGLQHQNSLMSQNSGLLSHQNSGINAPLSHQGSKSELLLPIDSARPSFSIENAAPLSNDLQTAQQQVMEIQAALAQMTLQHSASQQNLASNPNSRRNSVDKSNSKTDLNVASSLPVQQPSASNLQVTNVPDIDRRPSVASNISNVSANNNSGGIKLIPDNVANQPGQNQQPHRHDFRQTSLVHHQHWLNSI